MKITDVFIFSSLLSVFVLILLVLFELRLLKANLFPLQLLTGKELFISGLPELGVVFFFLEFVLFLLLLLFNLVLT